MGVKTTSRSAYRKQVIEGKTATQRERILEFLERHALPRNRRQISLLTGIPINAVCGRVNALLENGDLRIACVDVDPTTGKRVEYLEPTPRIIKQGRMF